MVGGCESRIASWYLPQVVGTILRSTWGRVMGGLRLWKGYNAGKYQEYDKPPWLARCLLRRGIARTTSQESGHAVG